MIELESPDDSSGDDNEDDGVLDTFSLSFGYKMGISKAMGGIRKIVEGIAECEYCRRLLKYLN